MMIIAIVNFGIIGKGLLSWMVDLLVYPGGRDKSTKADFDQQTSRGFPFQM
jgi:hypothetical protein